MPLYFLAFYYLLEITALVQRLQLNEFGLVVPMRPALMTTYLKKDTIAALNSQIIIL